MAASLSETLEQLRSFVETSISDIENKYQCAIREKEASLEEKIARLGDSNKELQDDNNRLAAKVQELSGKLEQVRAKLCRKDEELQQKDQWWEAYKQMSQKRFRVMKRTGTFPQDTMDNYVNKSIQELISTCMNTDEKARQTRIIRLSRNKHSKKTRYEDIPGSHVGQTTTVGGLWEEKESNDSRHTTQLDPAGTQDTGQHALSDVGIVAPNTPAADCVMGPPSASSTPLSAVARGTQYTNWAPVTRLPPSDSQFSLDLSHTQPLSPTIPSNAPTPNGSQGGKADASYSLLPPVQECVNLGGRAKVSDEVGSKERIIQAHGDGMQDKLLNCGKRKRKDSWKAHSPEPGCPRTAVFKVPEPVSLRDLPKQANHGAAPIKCSESEMETSAVDMFADHSLTAGSASGDSKHTARDDCGGENGERQCETPTEDGPFDNRKPHQKAKKFKYVEVVRRKEEREKLNGYACRDCQKYFESLDLPEKELRERLKQCSRHRAKFSPPPSTPPGFWNLSFPDTQTYIDNGYLQTEPHPRKKARKKKPTQEENHARKM